MSGLTATVDDVHYDAQHAGSPDRPYSFVYRISIHNNSNEKVRVFGRKWIVREKSGSTLVVEGEGVVGEFPELEPGRSFTYSSFHVVRDDSLASGSFFATTATGNAVAIPIPQFEMRPPQWV